MRNTRERTGLVWAAWAAVLLLACTSAGAEVRYTITDIPTFGGTESGVSAINERGQAACGRKDSSGLWQGFMWEDGVFTELHLNSSWNLSLPKGINEHGMVSGWANHVSAGMSAQLWNTTLGTVIDIGIPSGQVRSQGQDLNDDNVVVGYSLPQFGVDSWRAFKWTADNGIIPLANFGGEHSYAMDINNSGQIAGMGETASGARRACLWDPDGTPHNIGGLGGETWAWGINEAAEIVGRSELDNGDEHAFFYEPVGGMQDLGTLGGAYSIAVRLNNLGHVVGNAEIDNGDRHAFLYKDGVMTDLNDLIDPASGWVLLKADDINDSGQIVGCGIIGGEQHGVLLTPIPEPATVGLVVLGSSLAALLRRRRRKR